MPIDLQLFLLQKLLPTLFVFCVGACVGSLISVLVSRLPRGEDVVVKPSYCPSCNEKLRWRDNIPIIGWIKLKGRCRSCRTPISKIYPILELSVGIMFALVWMQCYWPAVGQSFLGLDIWKLTPEWARSGWEQTWPLYAVVVACFSCLLAMTIIDARTFMIPLELPWACALIGLVVHVGWAVVIQNVPGWGGLRQHAYLYLWSIAHPSPSAWAPEFAMPQAAEGFVLAGNTWWWWAGAAIGATLGLGLSLLFLKLGVIRRSFLDYDAWEQRQLATQKAEAEAAGREAKEIDDPTELWVLYPHARREMIKELAFLAAPVLLGLLGGYLAYRWTSVPTAIPQGVAPSEIIAVGGAHMPLWLIVLTGVLLGYLVAGGVLWAIRILGTLGFGKEALGMGDIHLMAGVGACLGWIDATLAFFLSAPVALAGWVVGWVIAKTTGNTKGTTLPFGPWLSVATVLVFVGKPWIEAAFTALMQAKPPINWP